MKTLKRSFRILKTNLGTLVIFELITKLSAAALMISFFHIMMELLMKLGGFKYLNGENIGAFCRHPLAIFLPVLIIAFAVPFTMFDMSAIIYIMHHNYHYRKTRLWYVMDFALKNTKEMYKKGNRAIMFTVFCQFLLFSLSQLPYILATVSFPVPMLHIVKKLKVWLWVLLVLLFLVVYLQLFVVNYFTLEMDTYRKSLRKSLRLGRFSKVVDFLLLLGIMLGAFLLYIGFLALAIFLLLLIGKLTPLYPKFFTVTTNLINVTVAILLLVFQLISVPLFYIPICFYFYRHKTRTGEETPSPEEFASYYNIELCPLPKELRGMKRFKKLLAHTFSIETLVVVAALSICSFYAVKLYRGELGRNIDYIKTIEVTAHRGASAYYPENTMSAFEGAIDQGADWIELDVQESKDRHIIVMHDSNFWRTTGYDANSWELTYDQILQLDASGAHQQKYKGEIVPGEKIPLLSEVIDLAKKEKVRLNIEIKPNKEDKFLEADLVKLLQEKDFIGSCVVTSQAYTSIQKVKQLDPSIKTVYVTNFAYGDIVRMKAADAFSIKHITVSERLVNKIHASGKEVYVWTIDTPTIVDTMILRQVDNIITNDVPMVKERIQMSDISIETRKYINRLKDLLNYDTVYNRLRKTIKKHLGM